MNTAKRRSTSALRPSEASPEGTRRRWQSVYRVLVARRSGSDAPLSAADAEN
ncbi:hypothetical protein SF06_13370 [Pseudomonas flexibilis]|nr:hypothetical protein SF06_13370 [Pseudomonas flexibilis]